MGGDDFLRIAARHGLTLRDGEVVVGEVQAIARQRGDVAVGRTHVGRSLHLHHGAGRIVRQFVAGVERNIVGLAVHPVDDQITPVAQLVGQPLRGHAAEDGSAIVARVEHRQFARLAAHGPLHGADDVATLAQGA
jgi:hypothetical protein